MGLSYATPVDLWACGCIFAELYTRTALFDGKFEKDQLAKIFEILGTPSDEEWPENAAVLKSNFASLPKKAFSQLLPELEPQAEDLLEVQHMLFIHTVPKNSWNFARNSNDPRETFSIH